MSHNSYNNIKKYAAFIFMVFTVLSGSSDRIDSDNFSRMGKKAFIDILATSKLFVQDAKASSREADFRLSVNDHSGFRDLLDSDMSLSSLKHKQAYVLTFVVSYLPINNSIAKNNTWKSTLF